MPISAKNDLAELKQPDWPAQDRTARTRRTPTPERTNKAELEDRIGQGLSGMDSQDRTVRK